MKQDKFCLSTFCGSTKGVIESLYEIFNALESKQIDRSIADMYIMKLFDHNPQHILNKYDIIKVSIKDAVSKKQFKLIKHVIDPAYSIFHEDPNTNILIVENPITDKLLSFRYESTLDKFYLIFACAKKKHGVLLPLGDKYRSFSEVTKWLDDAIESYNTHVSIKHIINDVEKIKYWMKNIRMVSKY